MADQAYVIGRELVVAVALSSVVSSPFRRAVLLIIKVGSKEQVIGSQTVGHIAVMEAIKVVWHHTVGQ